jgi:hypothetical protein
MEQSKKEKTSAEDSLNHSQSSIAYFGCPNADENGMCICTGDCYEYSPSHLTYLDGYKEGRDSIIKELKAFLGTIRY